MPHSPLRVAAFLALTLLAPGAALAFDVQTLGSSSSGAAQQYADPYEIPRQTPGEEKPAAPNGMLMNKSGLQFGITTSGSARSTDEALGWTNPQPGRLTH